MTCYAGHAPFVSFTGLAPSRTELPSQHGVLVFPPAQEFEKRPQAFSEFL